MTFNKERQNVVIYPGFRLITMKLLDKRLVVYLGDYCEHFHSHLHLLC